MSKFGAKIFGKRQEDTGAEVKPQRECLSTREINPSSLMVG